MDIYNIAQMEPNFGYENDGQLSTKGKIVLATLLAVIAVTSVGLGRQVVDDVRNYDFPDYIRYSENGAYFTRSGQIALREGVDLFNAEAEQFGCELVTAEDPVNIEIVDFSGQEGLGGTSDGETIRIDGKKNFLDMRTGNPAYTVPHEIIHERCQTGWDPYLVDLSIMRGRLTITWASGLRTYFNVSETISYYDINGEYRTIEPGEYFANTFNEIAAHMMTQEMTAGEVAADEGFEYVAEGMGLTLDQLRDRLFEVQDEQDALELLAESFADPEEAMENMMMAALGLDYGITEVKE